MHCPNCRHILTVVQLDEIQVEHCNNCGGSLFEANEINRITLKDAQRLQLMKSTDVLDAGPKVSPRDNSPLVRIDTPSIPQHITLLQSASSGEVFAYADDLVAFKQAQDAKINYFRTWNIPVPNIAQIMVFSFALFASVGLAYFASLVSQPSTRTSQAQTLCAGEVGIVKTDKATFVTCTTPVDLDCNVKATCKNGTQVPLTCQDSTYLGTIPAGCQEIQFSYEGKDGVLETEWEYTE